MKQSSWLKRCLRITAAAIVLFLLFSAGKDTPSAGKADHLLELHTNAAETTATLALKKLPDKTPYNAGEELDLTGLELLLTDAQGNQQTVTMQDGITVVYGETVPGGDYGPSGIIVEYQGLRVTFEICLHQTHDWVEVLLDSSGYPESEHYEYQGDYRYKRYSSPGGQ